MRIAAFAIVLGMTACTDSTTGSGQSGTTIAADATIDGGASSDSGSTTDGAAIASDASTGADASTSNDATSGVTAKYATCSSAMNCARVACTADVPTGCAQPCLDGASPAAQAGLKAFLDCIEGTCKAKLCPPGAKPGCLGQCITSHCGITAIKCAADGKVGTASCDAAFNCLGKCENAPDWNCGGACYAGLSSQAQSQLDAMGNCAMASPKLDGGQTCPGELLTCASGGKSGFATCRETLTCFDKCGDNNDGCGLACFQAAEAKAQVQFSAAANCNAQGGGPACVDPMLACIAPTGSKTCTDVIACMQQCGSKPAGCTLDCMGDGSPAEAGKVLQLFGCSEANCKGTCAGDGACQQKCAQEKCPAEFKACLGF